MIVLRLWWGPLTPSDRQPYHRDLPMVSVAQANSARDDVLDAANDSGGGGGFFGGGGDPPRMVEVPTAGQPALVGLDMLRLVEVLDI